MDKLWQYLGYRPVSWQSADAFFMAALDRRGWLARFARWRLSRDSGGLTGWTDIGYTTDDGTEE